MHIIVSPKIRELIKMADTAIEHNAIDPEDLEDGEIESDCEEKKIDTVNENNHNVSNQFEVKEGENRIEDKMYYSKSGKKKKSKNKDQKSKIKKHSKRTSSPAEDFAGSIEKAIRKALNKDESDPDTYEDVDERRKRKKKKKHDGKDGSSKKRKKQEYLDDVDENEMMCIRGASPVHRNSPPADNFNEDESYQSDSSQDSRDFRQRQRPLLRKNKSDRRRAHQMQDADGVCLYYMQGKCHKGDDCIYSHDAQPPRKMELCKFYLMDCCAKRDKCLYMHSDFPCKFYHTGLPCIYKEDECKFAHGKPLSDPLKLILLKHIESAPKEILGEFPRLSKEGAANMMNNTQIKLSQQYGIEPTDVHEKTIPSLFELNIPKPPNMTEPLLMNDKGHKGSPKIRHSRWQNEDLAMNLNITSNGGANVLSIKNLNGVLTPRQISDLTKMGIDNLDQLGQLTVLQLNSIGISLKQITEIQLNTMNIQKLGLISSNAESLTTPSTFITSMAGGKDLDLRVPPMAPVLPNAVIGNLSGKDVDMRFQQARPNIQSEEILLQPVETRINKDMIDIDQYTKDALKFSNSVTNDNDNIENSNDSLEKNKTYDNASTATSLSKDVDQRVLKFTNHDSSPYNKSNDIFIEKKGTDTDIRFLQPGPLFKNPHKSPHHRRSTTDDEDNNLLIDEKWYSSDEEKPVKPKSQASSPVPNSPQYVSQTPAIEPATVLSKLGDLSQFAISDEVTQLLNKMKSNLHDTKSDKSNENSDSSTKDPRNDPRTSTKRSPEHKSMDLSKSSLKRVPKVSIYECVEGEPTDGRRRSDVDLRQTDFKLPAFGDTDLRPNSSGDIDLRLGLPFKPLPNYTPASEIDGSINSHPPIPYKVVIIDIPRPDYTDIRNSTAKSQALLDPRLRKVFRLSIDESNSSDGEKPVKPVAAVPRIDPRRKQKEAPPADDKPTLDLQTVLQNSDWYKDLSSTQKIFVNQNLALVTSTIKQHQQDKLAGKPFDLAPVQSNSVLVNIFANLGVALNDNAEFSYLPKPKEGLLKTPTYNQNFGGPNFEGNINMMNMNMGPMNMGHMGPGYNHPSDMRGGPAPGLLGVAPNIPHNYDNNFGGPNFGNMPYNGNGNGNMEQNFQRFGNRGGPRGRWTRGGPRGHRDRNRGGWKGDRN